MEARSLYRHTIEIERISPSPSIPASFFILTIINKKADEYNALPVKEDYFDALRVLCQNKDEEGFNNFTSFTTNGVAHFGSEVIIADNDIFISDTMEKYY